MISTQRRLEYVYGYLTLGLLEEAAAELDLIEGQDRLSDTVLELAMDVYSLQQKWDLAVTAAQSYAGQNPDEAKGWISWAYALRRLKSIPDAEAVLLEGEKHIGSSCALIHYNLACYRCQLGDTAGAMERLTTACRMEPQWKVAALGDPDLAALKDEIAALDFG